MKIGVISDTHLDGPTAFLEKIVETYLWDAELILHAGDIHSLRVLDVFGGREVRAVAGNRDLPDVRRRFPEKAVIEVKGFRIGLTHGWGFPLGLERRVTSLFQDIHCLVFGHTHWPVNRKQDGLLLFNPGSLKGGLSSFWRRSIGLLSIDQDIRGEIIRV